MKPPIITSSPSCARARVLTLNKLESLCRFKSYISARATPIVLFTPRIIARVIACRQFCYNCRFPPVSWSVAAIPDIAYLVAGDDPAYDRMQPAIVRANQCSSAIVQFQRWIGQKIGHPVLTELRANRADNDSLRFSALNDKATNHHVIADLHKGARTDVAQSRCRRGRQSSGWCRCRCLRLQLARC